MAENTLLRYQVEPRRHNVPDALDLSLGDEDTHPPLSHA